VGVHIDGYIAVQATSMVVRDSEDEPVTGKAADAIACANTCFEAAMRMIRPGKRISEVAGPLNEIAKAYGCSLVDGVMTHNMKQFVIDGNKCILNKPNPEQKVEDATIEENEVYAIDIVVSTGSCLLTDNPATCMARTCVYEIYHGACACAQSIA
jgi:methionine aminopeptidase